MSERRHGDLTALLAAFARFGARRGAAGAVLIGAGALLDGAGLLLLAPLLSALLGDSAGGLAGRIARLVPGGDPGERITALLALFVGLIVARAAVLMVRDRTLAHLQHGFVEACRLRLIERIAAAPWRNVARLPRARVVQVLGAEIQHMGVAAHFILHGAVASAMLAIHLALAVALAPRLSVAAIALLIPAAALGWGMMPRIRRLGAAVIVDAERMTEETMRFLDGLKTAAAHDMQPAFVAEHRRLSGIALANRRAFFGVQAASRHVAGAAAALAGAATLLLGATVLRLDPAVLIVLAVVLARMGGPALLLQHSIQQIAHCLPAFAAARALEAECDAAGRISRPIPSRDMPATGPSLAFDRVTLLHPGSGRGIRRVSTTIPAGALVGIAGPSGAGKTSFADLAAGLLTPDDGALLVNDRPLTADRLTAHRNRVGYAGRDAVLFGDSIRRNLLWGTAGRSDPTMLEALDRLGAAELVRSRGGLDGHLGERGATLSAGEAQRLALVRLLLRGAPLLILDEATASLDAASERHALDVLRDRHRRPTILLVSHRAETLAQCDMVLRFEDGLLAGATEPSPPARASTGWTGSLRESVS